MSAMRLHHLLSVVVADINRSAEVYGQLLGHEPTTDIIYDRRQKVHIQFLAGVALADCQLELLAPGGEDSPVASALKKGGGPNQLCFEVTNLDKALQMARRHGCRVICEPIEAAAMDNRKIAFVFTPDQQIVEFVAAPASNTEPTG